jgi:hypothetical protein
VLAWLCSLGLAVYAPVLADNGFKDLEFVAELQQEDLSAMGILDPLHAHTIMLAARALSDPPKSSAVVAIESTAVVASGSTAVASELTLAATEHTLVDAVMSSLPTVPAGVPTSLPAVVDTGVPYIAIAAAAVVVPAISPAVVADAPSSVVFDAASSASASSTPPATDVAPSSAPATVVSTETPAKNDILPPLMQPPPPQSQAQPLPSVSGTPTSAVTGRVPPPRPVRTKSVSVTREVSVESAVAAAAAAAVAQVSAVAAAPSPVVASSVSPALVPDSDPFSELAKRPLTPRKDSTPTGSRSGASSTNPFLAAFETATIAQSSPARGLSVSSPESVSANPTTIAAVNDAFAELRPVLPSSPAHIVIRLAAATTLAPTTTPKRSQIDPVQAAASVGEPWNPFGGQPAAPAVVAAPQKHSKIYDALNPQKLWTEPVSAQPKETVCSSA